MIIVFAFFTDMNFPDNKFSLVQEKSFDGFIGFSVDGIEFCLSEFGRGIRF